MLRCRIDGQGIKSHVSLFFFVGICECHGLSSLSSLSGEELGPELQNLFLSHISEVF
jgi:hypothetical protein